MVVAVAADGEAEAASLNGIANMIKLENLTKIYNIGTVNVPALNGVSLDIKRGELLSIMGPSGSGKSTLMHMLGCLDTPSSGRYLLEGEEVGSLNENQLAEIRNRKIGFVFQTYNLLPRLTAQANVELPLLYGNGSARKERATDALERVGLADRTAHRPTELSGGEQQRVGIARALVKDPTILLADEPTGNLDSRSSEEIMAILQWLNREEGMTVVIISHDSDVAAQTNRVVSMLDGLIISDEPVVNPLIVPPSPSGGPV